MMKKVLLTGFAVLGVASLIIGSTVTNGKFHSTQHTVLTILDTVPNPASPKFKPVAHYNMDTISKQGSPLHPGLVARS